MTRQEFANLLFDHAAGKELPQDMLMNTIHDLWWEAFDLQAQVYGLQETLDGCPE